MILKNNKGVTLIALVTTIIAILIITSITIYNFSGQLEIKKVNNLYSDIENLNEKVSAYYINNDKLPEFDKKYTKSDLETINYSLYDNLNKNDSDEYYIINLSKLENLTLNYGRQYSMWENNNKSANLNESNDVYIINEMTHQIYYVKGITYDGKKYFTKDADIEQIDAIQIQEGTNNYIIKINESEIELQDSDSLIYGLKNKITSKEGIISLNIQITEETTNSKTDKLEYCFAKVNSEEASNFTAFNLNTENKATLVSKQLSEGEYYLIIKIFDQNGNKYEYKIGGITITY